MKSRFTLRAAAILPMSGRALRDGAITIRGGRIVAVQPWRNLSGRERAQAVDLGDVLVLPGLVNAHCHLDYTHMAGLLPPQKSFVDWVRLIVSIKSEWDLRDYAASWKVGADMLLRHGTTAVADIEAVPQLLPRLWAATPLRVISFLEMIGISGDKGAKRVLAKTSKHLRRLRSDGFRVGLSPHAPYSTTPGLMREACTLARTRRRMVSTHIAESSLESEMFGRARGEMYDWLARSGRDMSDCGGISPVAHMWRCNALMPTMLGVHLNHLGPGDAALLASHHVSVAHCPRSHFYFSHPRFPVAQLKRAGVNICLGTDSLASVYRRRNEKVQLDMFAEMRELARAWPALSEQTILRMATANGGRALGMPGRLGVLQKNAYADLIVLPFHAKSSGLYRSVLKHEGPVLGSMINGRWAICPLR